jgi:hypothetical protein
VKIGRASAESGLNLQLLYIGNIPGSKDFKMWCRIILPDGFLELVRSEII